MQAEKSLSRPLKVLVPLIKDELEAADAAGLEHYRAAGEMLQEAKEQVKHGEWAGWLQRNFHLSGRTAERYMALAEIPKTTRASFSSIREALGSGGGGSGGGKVSWQAPVQQVIARVNVDALAQERQNRENEKKLLRQLSHQLVDIGYKVLAAKLHPDKGGSTDAMKRLNEVRRILKEAI